MGRLDHKVALITGGASGLGEAISRRLAAEGARVVITDIQTTAGSRLARSLNGLFLEQDVTHEAQWTEIIQQVEDKYEALHILVNNAGVTGPMDNVTPENTTLSNWRLIHQINVEGVFLGCRAAIPALRRSGGGSIVNMSSIAGLLPTPDAMAYGATKAEVIHITRSVALHCARDGSKIRCNSVHPGNILTPMLQKAMDGIARRRGVPYESVVEEFKSEIPQKEFQEPEDVASAIVFLVSDEARHITGIKLVVDGGIALSCGQDH
jgi:3(or 17)beta-hydroxysteroid dehydrogenase